MANNIPFQPMGNCVVATAATANTQGNVVAITSVSPVNQYFVSNPDKNDPVFVAYGKTVDITATIPDGNSSAVLAIPPYEGRVFSGPQTLPGSPTYIRIIAPHNNAKLYVTPGEGL